MRPDGPRDAVVGPDSGPEPPFPLKLDGEVVKGFGRGSKELGIPTANIPIEGLSVGGHSDIESGVYYGWAGLSAAPPAAAAAATSTSSPTSTSTTTTITTDQGDSTASVYPMVMSIGWNPFYKNTVRSVEVHILHPFTSDFYGSHMNLCILGFIRPEYDYVSKESLIEDIREDCAVALRSLGRTAYEKFRGDAYLLDFGGRSGVGK